MTTTRKIDQTIDRKKRIIYFEAGSLNDDANVLEISSISNTNVWRKSFKVKETPSELGTTLRKVLDLTEINLYAD